MPTENATSAEPARIGGYHNEGQRRELRPRTLTTGQAEKAGEVKTLLLPETLPRAHRGD